MTRLLSALAAALVFAAAGCGGSAPAGKPPEIRYGVDACDRCGMIISEARFAAAYVTDDGAVRRFDDVGEMLAYHATLGEPVAAYWVHDYESAEWLRADAAWYVEAPGIVTPMGHGVVAVASRDRAQALAGERGGMALAWAEVLRRSPGTGKAP